MLEYLYLKIFHPEIVSIQNVLRKDGYLVGNYQWVRHCNLLHLLKKYNPKSICEYGSGASTGLFAYIIKQSNESKRFVSYEEHEDWFNNVKKAIGILNDSVDFRLVFKVVKDNTCFYDISHDEYFDFVYVDGPYNDIDGVLLPCVDVGLMWDNGVFPKVVAVHIRTSTTEYLRNHHWSGKYVFFKYGDHNVFVLR